MRECVRWLERGQYSFEPRQQLKCFKRFRVGCGRVLHALQIMQPGMLRPDAWIIKTRRDRMRIDDLAVIVLKEIAALAVQTAEPSADYCRRRLAGLDDRPAGLNADDFDIAIIEEWMEQPHRIRAAANAGNERIRQTALALQNLRARLFADHRLKLTYHLRVGMRASDR